MKKSIIYISVVLLIIISLGGYYYYNSSLKPKYFVESFFKQLEFKGVEHVSIEYFILERSLSHIPSWQSFSNDTTIYHATSEEEKFEIWKKLYLSDLTDYGIDVSIKHPNFSLLIETDKSFKNTFSGIEFSRIEIGNIEVSNNSIDAVAYAKVNISDKPIANEYFGGDKKIELIARNGIYGWKIIAFAIHK